MRDLHLSLRSVAVVVLLEVNCDTASTENECAVCTGKHWDGSACIDTGRCHIYFIL